MRNVVVIFLIYLFASFGFICFLRMLIESIDFSHSFKNTKKVLAVLVKNQEESVEGSIRRIISSEILKKASLDGELIILDMGSTDKTMEILEKLQYDNDCVGVIKNSEKERIFNVFSQSQG